MPGTVGTRHRDEFHLSLDSVSGFHLWIPSLDSMAVSRTGCAPELLFPVLIPTRFLMLGCSARTFPCCSSPGAQPGPFPADNPTEFLLPSAGSQMDLSPFPPFPSLGNVSHKVQPFSGHYFTLFLNFFPPYKNFFLDSFSPSFTGFTLDAAGQAHPSRGMDSELLELLSQPRSEIIKKFTKGALAAALLAPSSSHLLFLWSSCLSLCHL